MNGRDFSGEEASGSWVPGPPSWEHAVERERGRRRALLRRLAALLGTGTLAFTLTTWILLQHERRAPAPVVAPASAPAPKDGTPKDIAPESASDPLRTARAQLVALNHNDIRAAYEFFSPKYRSKVPFTVFQKLVTSHRRMFHTEENDAETRNQTTDRVYLDIHVTSADDEDYVAHYTLVRLTGRWWVDDLRWGYEDDQGNDLSSA